jgi:hypothetical protein
MRRYEDALPPETATCERLNAELALDHCLPISASRPPNLSVICRFRRPINRGSTTRAFAS